MRIESTPSQPDNSRHAGAFLAFDAAWFQRHQSVLLWLLNAWAVRAWFRWVLRIRWYDCPSDARICEIGPSHFVTPTGRPGEYRADFRTHPKYSKRLYFAFRPLWWVMHGWDLLADWHWPQLSFGFSTLTVYPDPNPETSSVDGHSWRTGRDETFASLIAGSADGAADSNAGDYYMVVQASTTTNQFTGLLRSMFLFSTSSLGSSATISAATLSLYGLARSNSLGSCNLTLVSSSPVSNTAIASGDHGSLGSTSFGSIAYADWSITGYNALSLNASGISNISKTGVSKFGARAEWDRAGSFSGTWGSSLYSSYSGYYADQTGTAQDPKLVVTYTVTESKTLTVVQYSTRSMSRTTAMNRTLSVAQTSVASFAKTIVRLWTLTVEQASSADLSYLQAKVLEVATASVVSVTCGINKLLSVAQGSVVSFTRGIGYAMSVAQSSSVSLAANRFYTQLLEVVTASIAAVQTGLFYPVVMQVWQESTATIQTLRGRVLTVVQSSNVSFQRSIGKVMSVAQSGIARVIGLSAKGNIGMLPSLPAKILRSMNWLRRQ